MTYDKIFWPSVRFDESEKWVECTNAIPPVRNDDPTVRPLLIQKRKRLKGKRIPVHGEGFVELVDYMGSDEGIVKAARLSYQAGTERSRSDRGLLRYLMRHQHSTPFEQTAIQVYWRLPIFVARQFVRHRTQSLSELSARYSVMPKEFFEFKSWELATQSKANRQGRGDMIESVMAIEYANRMKDHNEESYALYEKLLNEGDVAREIARTVLPVSIYTEYVFTISLHNLLHMIQLRTDPHAQRETRMYAEVLENIVWLLFPQTWEAYNHYRKRAVSLSTLDQAALGALTRGDNDILSHFPSKGEYTEFIGKVEAMGLEELLVHLQAADE